jgi:flagellar assembly protein FliH
MSSSKKPVINIPAPQGSKAQSLYGRFIPKEELESFSSWNPDVVGSSEAHPPAGVRKSAGPEPKPPPPNPAEELAKLMRNTRQQGYQDGYRDGMAALDAFKQSYAQQLSAQLGALTQSLMSQFENLQHDMAAALVETATQLARQVVRSELKTRPELIAQVAEEAVGALMLSAKHITVRVHPNDHRLVSTGAGETLAARGARVVSDPSLSPGGCAVESDTGLIEASIETRWRRAMASIGASSEWHNEPPHHEGNDDNEPGEARAEGDEP